MGRAAPALMAQGRIQVIDAAVELPRRDRLFVTPWTAACQAFLSLTISRSSPKFMSIESVMVSNPSQRG